MHVRREDVFCVFFLILQLVLIESRRTVDPISNINGMGCFPKDCTKLLCA